MTNFNWTCPHCERDVTIVDQKHSVSHHHLVIENADGDQILASEFAVCPNVNCNHFTLWATLHARKEITNASGRPKISLGKEIRRWNLIPESRARNFPSYIPVAIRDDYREACLIREASPKASATLSRRCLQGMIRDFWDVKGSRLVDEIEEIQNRVDPITWQAIDAIRKLGNIGAHMEKDINLIVDVDPTETELLIGLIEQLMREWYINREERKNRMEGIIHAASNKKPVIKAPSQLKDDV